MSLELLLSSLLSTALMVLTYLCRRSISSVHILSLGLFCVALPMLRALFGVSPWPASDETLLFSFGGVALYAISILLTSTALKANGLRRLAHWLENANPSGESIRAALLIFFIVWPIRIYKGAAYDIFFSGSATEDAVLAVPYWLSTMDSLMALLGGGALLLLTVAAARRGPRWLWILIAVELIWYFVSGGRREVTFLFLVIVWVAWRAQVVRLPVVLLALALAASAVYVVTPLFLAVRNDNANNQFEGATTFDALTFAAADAYAECGFGSRCVYLTDENIRDRRNAMEFTKSVVNATRDGFPYLYGAGLVHSLSWAIPSVIVRKPEMMTEQFVEDHFGLPLVDDAISVPALAYADLGLLGCILAGIFLALFIELFSRLALNQSNELLALTMLFGLIRSIWNIEGDPLSYTVLLRDCTLLILITQAPGFFRKFQFR